MIYNNMEFFNVAELLNVDNFPGLRINRFPNEIIEAFEIPNPASNSRGCEIRFSMEDKAQLNIYLLSLDYEGEVLLFFGDYLCSNIVLPKGVITAVPIIKPGLLKKKASLLDENARFPTKICRLFLNTRSIVHYCGIDTFGNEIMPPKEEEKPKTSWLAYGSSITHGALAVSNYNSYVHQAARLLNSQVYNFGMGGACRCEKKIADYIANFVGVDFITLEIGVNLLGVLTPEEFYERAKYLIETVAEKQKGKKIFVITIFTNSATYDKNHIYSQIQDDYNNILRKITSNNILSNVYLIEGSEILKKFTNLSADLIHPTESGHTEMAYNLYEILLKKLD